MAAAMLLVAALPASAATGFLKGEQISGSNKICFYDVYGSAYAVTVRSFDLCALQVDTEANSAPTRRGLDTRQIEPLQQPSRRSPGVDWNVPDLGQRAANEPTFLERMRDAAVQRAEIREAQNREREARLREEELNARAREGHAPKAKITTTKIAEPTPTSTPAPPHTYQLDRWAVEAANAQGLFLLEPIVPQTRQPAHAAE
jgi:hypothetical protein